jgi:sigma-54 dependent transcriptional regulator, acetoin dehydrogenase operon transcriptional activator AcoR
MNALNDLRSRAEVVLLKKSIVPPGISTLPTTELQKLVHELQVHQVELELQNHELRRTQLELQESQNNYQDLYHLAPIGYLTVDRKGFVLDANLTAANLLGLDRDSLIGKSLSCFLSKEDSDILYLRLKRILQTRKKLTCELRFAKENGEQIHVQLEGVATQKQDGNVTRLRILLSDISGRKRAEEEALARFEEIEDLYNNAPCGYHSLDKDGVFVRINNTELSWLGYTRDQVIGNIKFPDILTNESLITFQENFPRLKERGWVKDLEFDLIRKDGTILPVILSATAIKDSAGNYLMSRSTVFDITEQKRAKQALSLSEQRYKALYEDSSDGVLLMDCNATIVDANNKAIEMFEYTLEELRSKTISDLIDPQSFETKPFIFDEMLVGQTIRLERPMFKKNGELIFVELTGRRMGENLFQGIYRDVTERKLAEEALKRSEERFTAIFEGAKDFFFIKDLSLRYTHVNPATAKLLGVPVSEVLGKTAEDIFDSESAQYTREIDTRVLKGERIEEISVKKIKGVPMTFHEVRTPMRDSSGEIIGICGISRDVTDLNRLQDTQKVDPQEYRSEIMRTVLKQASFAASGKSVILLLGESGVGKDYLAKYIHERSSYSSGRYFSINCTAIPSELAESELFGHEAGAFTGAGRQKRGLLELAEGGTLLLNEIGELSPALQAKFLTFLDTKTFTRVGGEQKIKVNARILAATNRELEQEISNGRFRSDLYYRLNVFSLRIPPLRERMEDLPILVTRLLGALAKELQMSFAPELTAGEMTKLYNYHWPGNIRELRNVLERALILSGGGIIKVDIEQCSDGVSTSTKTLNITETSTLADSVENLSRSMIQDALTRSQGRKELAASFLGVSRYALRRRIKKLGLDVRD